MSSANQPTEYSVQRNPIDGAFQYILKSDGKRIGLADPDYQTFLAWNSRQVPPLIVEEYEFPKGHKHITDIVTLVEHCRENGVMLFVGHEADSTPLVIQTSATFPEKGHLCLLCEAGERKDGQNDGILPLPARIWVPVEMARVSIPYELCNPESDLRRVTSWPIHRTFVYIDVSDFSKAPPGQEVLIINALARMVDDSSLWSVHGQGLPAAIEARMCIGDGYIFVFKDAIAGAYFAAYLAHLIETLVAIRWLAVDFHFRMGVHCRPVYTFWDTGRNGWNYIGDGINGGNRVLSAMGKTYDDTVYISGEVRQALMATPSANMQRQRLLAHLHNRGRQPDKHGRLWRVYEVNHAAVCAGDLPLNLVPRA